MSEPLPLQSFFEGYSEVSKTAVVEPGSGQQLMISEFTAHNRSGGSADLGLLIKLSASAWAFGQIDDSETPDYVDQDAAIKAGTAVDIFTTTNNDGFLVQARKQFGLIGFTISQADAGAPTYEYTYFNGTSYVALTLIAEPVYTSTGDIVILFAPPHDWVAGTTAAVGGGTINESEDLFSIRVRATTAPAPAVQANDLWLGSIIDFQEAAADNAKLSISFDERRPLTLESTEGLLPYFSTANAANIASGFYSTAD